MREACMDETRGFAGLLIDLPQNNMREACMDETATRVLCVKANVGARLGQNEARLGRHEGGVRGRAYKGRVFSTSLVSTCLRIQRPEWSAGRRGRRSPGVASRSVVLATDGPGPETSDSLAAIQAFQLASQVSTVLFSSGKAGEAPLVLGNEDRLEAAVAIAWHYGALGDRSGATNTTASILAAMLDVIRST